MATQAIPSHCHIGDFLSGACEFSGKLAGFQNPPAGFGHKSKGGSFGGEPTGFLKSADSLKEQ